MDTLKRFTKNSIALLIAKGFSVIFAMAFGIYAARTLGDTGYGRYGFMVVLLSYFMVTSEFGLESLIVRDVSTQKGRGNDYLMTSMLFKLITASISVLLTIVTILLLGRQDILSVGIVASLTLIPLAIYMSFDACFRAHEKMEYIAVVEIVYMALRSGAGIVLLMDGQGLVTLFTAFVIVECVRLLMIAVLYHIKISHLGFTFNRELFGHFWKESRHLALWKMLGVLYTRVEVLILFILLGDATVGWYKVSLNITDLISILSMVAMNAILPVMSNFFLESRDKLLELYRTAFRYIFIVMMPVAMGITVYADTLIGLLYGGQYANSVLILRVLIWSSLLSFILALLGTVILVVDKFKLAAKLSLINTTVRILLNVVLIQNFGFIGAPLAAVISNGFSLILFMPVVTRAIGHSGVDLVLIRSVGIAVAIVLLGYFSYLQCGNLSAVIGVGYSIYLVLMFKTKMVTDKEIRMVKQALCRGT